MMSLTKLEDDLYSVEFGNIVYANELKYYAECLISIQLSLILEILVMEDLVLCVGN